MTCAVYCKPILGVNVGSGGWQTLALWSPISHLHACSIFCLSHVSFALCDYFSDVKYTHEMCMCTGSDRAQTLPGLQKALLTQLDINKHTMDLSP
jgi:hypothetical protein